MQTVTRGRELAHPVLMRTAAEATEIQKRLGRQATLAIVSATDSTARRFVDMKRRALGDVGVAVHVTWLDSGIETQQAREDILRLNTMEELDAIFLQFPFPEGIAPEPLANAISIEKDIDCSGDLAEAAFHDQRHPYTPVAPLAALQLLKAELGTVGARHITVYSQLDPFARVLRTLLEREQAVVELVQPSAATSEQTFAHAGILVIGESIPPPEVFNTVTSLDLLQDVRYALPPRPADWIPAESKHRVRRLMTQYGNVGPLTVAYLAHSTVQAASLRSRVSLGDEECVPRVHRMSGTNGQQPQNVRRSR